jgi:DtxR family transcriptional regulator, Mn-dependent transcriptional regulator
VLDQQPEVLRYLERVGLTPSATLEVLEVLPFDGQMFLEVAGSRASISASLATRLLVTEVEEA